MCPLSWRRSSPTHASANSRSKPPPQKLSRSGPDHHLRSVSAPSVQQSGKPLTANLSPSPQASTHLPAPDSRQEVVLELRKPLSEERHFCIDYRWINQSSVSRQVLTPDHNDTVANCRNAKRMTKLDIICAFNRLLMHADSSYLTAFKTRQGTFH
jgi:hypothetical protein